MTPAERDLANRNALLNAQVAEMERKIAGLRREMTSDEMNEIGHAQMRADAVALLWGTVATQPLPGERPLDFRKRLAGHFQKHSPRFKDARLDALDAATFFPIEDVIYNDAAAAARDPHNHPPGKLVALRELDSAGRTITKFTGCPLGWMAPFMLGGQVGSFVRPRSE